LTYIGLKTLLLFTYDVINVLSSMVGTPVAPNRTWKWLVVTICHIWNTKTDGQHVAT